MTRLIAMRSCPAGGKSTWVKNYLVDHPGAVVVSRDAIRFSLYGVYFGHPIDEDYVTVVQDATVIGALRAGKDVIVDDCNVQQRYINHWSYIAWEYGAEFSVQQMDIDVNVAIERNSKRDRKVPDDVIRRFHKDLQKSYQLPQYPDVEPYVSNKNFPRAILVDVDGTIAKNTGGRSFYDWNRVGEDSVVDHIKEIVNLASLNDTKILVVSGRDGSCYDITSKWLVDNEICYDKLLMRDVGDQRKDSIVKYEIFDNEIRNNYNVIYSLDDRDQVVALYRRLGVPCLQVDYGNF